MHEPCEHLMLPLPVLSSYGSAEDMEPVMLALAALAAGCGDCWEAATDRVAVSVGSMLGLRLLMSEGAALLGIAGGPLVSMSEGVVGALSFGDRRDLAAGELGALAAVLRATDSSGPDALHSDAMKRRLQRGHGPEAHLQELYIDTDAMIENGIATSDEMALIALVFAIMVDVGDDRLCERCGVAVLDRVGATPGIVEAAMHVAQAASGRLGFMSSLVADRRYDCFNPVDRKNAMCDIAEYWADVVVKMRSCGAQCRVCVAAGPHWRSIVGRH